MAAGELAEFIRGRSKAGELLTQVDLETELAGRQAPVADPTAEPVPATVLIREAMSTHPDLRVILDDAGCAYYFSEQSLSGAYARVLLLKRQGPLSMMAEVIREHSRVYPRPVPLALFQAAPFSLNHDELDRSLNEMMGNARYRDIARLTTSIGNVFLYSTDHLDPGYAAMLAEWTDVGQAENP